MWGAYVGSPISKQSLKFAWLERCCGGEGETFVASTFAAILAEIAAVPLEKGTIHLNTKVVGVNTTDKTKDEGKVIVTTEKGEKHEFDEVLMTTPLGWLKRNKHIFSPPLPARIEQALDNITLSKLEKVRLPPPSHPLLLPFFSSAPS